MHGLERHGFGFTKGGFVEALECTSLEWTLLPRLSDLAADVEMTLTPAAYREKAPQDAGEERT